MSVKLLFTIPFTLSCLRCAAVAPPAPLTCSGSAVTRHHDVQSPLPLHTTPATQVVADRSALRPRLCRSAGKKFENTEMFGQYPLQVNGFKDLHECLEAAMIEGEIESLHSAENSARSGQEVGDKTSHVSNMELPY